MLLRVPECDSRVETHLRSETRGFGVRRSNRAHEGRMPSIPPPPGEVCTPGRTDVQAATLDITKGASSRPTGRRSPPVTTRDSVDTRGEHRRGLALWVYRELWERSTANFTEFRGRVEPSRSRNW